MLYEFQAEDGERIAVERPASDYPRLGEPLELGGKVYYRVLSDIRVKVALNPHFVSHSLPRAQRQPDGSLYSPYSEDVTPEGKPRFSSWKQVREAEGYSKNHDAQRAVVYD